MSATTPLPEPADLASACGPLRVTAWAAPDDHRHLAVLATERGASKLPHATVLPLAWLGGTSRTEFWRSSGGALRRDESPALSLAWTEDVLFGVLRVDDTPTGAMRSAERAYRTMTDACARFGFPHLLRVWNWLGAINEGDGDRERYRQFCVGRARVIPQPPPQGYAAATAIGIPAGAQSLQLHFLAARRPGLAIENPRQTSAWRYPREYGPAAPGFSRAMLLDWAAPPLLLVSGTASVLGHASAHGDVLAQMDETLHNIEALLERAGQHLGVAATLGSESLLRVYLRDAQDASVVSARLLARYGASLPFMILHGEICRRELLIEIEAAHTFG